MKKCILCGGEMSLMGSLGRRKHYRCKNCGIEQSGIPDVKYLHDDLEEHFLGANPRKHKDYGFFGGIK